MLIGAMNHPAENIYDELRWMAEMGMEFVDFTLEPPETASWRVDARAIRRALDESGLLVVGHTAFYLPMASAIEELRQASLIELRRCIDVFSDAGARYMNIHPDRYTPMHSRGFYISRNIDTLGELIEHGKKRGVSLMIENLPGDYNDAFQLGELLRPLPDLGLHLDIGHANLRVAFNTTENILAEWGPRLRHVHLHDNKGGYDDLHLPLGAGTLDLRRNIGALIKCGYDGTITLEVFSRDRHYLAYSRDVLRALWNDLTAEMNGEHVAAPGLHIRPGR
jgi:sugar phosphate isomerase/epimerase